MRLPAALLAAAAVGGGLGLVQAVPTAWTSWAGPVFPGPVRMALPFLTMGGFAVLFRLWFQAGRAIPRAAVIGLAGFFYYLAATYWLGESFVEPGQYYSARAALGLFGAMWILFPWWIVGALLGQPLSRAGRPLLSALALTCGMAVGLLGLNDLVYGIPLAPISAVILDTPVDRLLAVTGQEALSTAIMGLGFALGAIRVRAAAALVGLLAAMMVSASFLPARTTLPPVSPAPIALVQTGSGFFRHDDPDAATGDVIALARSAFDAGAYLVILPENILPFDLEDAGDPLTAAVMGAVPPGRFLIVGYSRVEAHPERPDQFRPLNKVALLSDGRILSSHAKAHLVPFGEYSPALFRLMGFDAMTGPPGGFGHADAMSVLRMPGLPPAGVAICFEAILSGAVSRETAGAGWIVNPSSERMFGNTLASRQLLDVVRLRALETGLPVLRATTTGLTAHVDGHGVVQSLAAPGEPSVTMTRLSAADPTWFRQVGQTPYLVLLGLLAVMLMIGRGAAALGAMRNGVFQPEPTVTTR